MKNVLSFVLAIVASLVLTGSSFAQENATEKPPVYEAAELLIKPAVSYEKMKEAYGDAVIWEKDDFHFFPRVELRSGDVLLIDGRHDNINKNAFMDGRVDLVIVQKGDKTVREEYLINCPYDNYFKVKVDKLIEKYIEMAQKAFLAKDAFVEKGIFKGNLNHLGYSLIIAEEGIAFTVVGETSKNLISITISDSNYKIEKKFLDLGAVVEKEIFQSEMDKLLGEQL